MRAAAYVVWEMNFRECDLVVVVVGVISGYVECSEATRNYLWFCVQRLGDWLRFCADGLRV